MAAPRKKRKDSKRDRQILSTLFASEDTLGQKPFSWQELEDLGCTLDSAEAEKYVAEGGLDDGGRSDLYCSLFQYHPELRAVLKPVFKGVPNHIVAKLSRSGGPDPLMELCV